MSDELIYKIGLIKIKEDEAYELKNKIASLKDEIVQTFNSPFCATKFEKLSQELIKLSKQRATIIVEIEKLKD